MQTVKQVSQLTGVSVRTLQFYDEIDLLKPAAVTAAGYRLYDDAALQKLQQILFFKELDFTLKEIKAIMEDPAFDKAAAYEKQRELIRMKRDRLNALLGLLDRLVEGETCMNFEDFDMRAYTHMLTEFKKTHAQEIERQFGSMEQYEKVLAAVENRKEELAALAVKIYGSVDRFTKATESNLQDFLAHGPTVATAEAGDLIAKNEALTRQVTADRSREPASPEVQDAVRKLMEFTAACNGSMDMGENYWPFLVECFATNPAYIEVTDRKYGAGASQYLARALQIYLERQ